MLGSLNFRVRRRKTQYEPINCEDVQFCFDRLGLIVIVIWGRVEGL